MMRVIKNAKVIVGPEYEPRSMKLWNGRLFFVGKDGVYEVIDGKPEKINIVPAVVARQKEQA